MKIKTQQEIEWEGKHLRFVQTVASLPKTEQ